MFNQGVLSWHTKFTERSNAHRPRRASLALSRARREAWKRLQSEHPSFALRASPWAHGPSAAGGGWIATSTSLSQTIRSAIERGITLIDTAPVYGFGRSEEIVGLALSGGLRDRAVIARRSASNGRRRCGELIARAHSARIEQSLRRLRTDYIDLYQVHWPDPLVPIQETAAALAALLKEGRSARSGVQLFPEQMAEFSEAAPIHSVTPYNLFEREAESGVLPSAPALHEMGMKSGLESAVSTTRTRQREAGRDGPHAR